MKALNTGMTVANAAPTTTATGTVTEKVCTLCGKPVRLHASQVSGSETRFFCGTVVVHRRRS
jgi:hypothetical protein